MNITVDRGALERALQVVARLAPVRTTIPVLTGVLVEPLGDAVRLSATDLDTAVRIRVPARCEGDDSVVLPARHLADLVRLAPAACDTVSLTAANGNFVDVALTDGARHRVRALTGGFPALPDSVGNDAVTLDPVLLADAIRHTAFAAANTTYRPILTGVRFHVDSGGVDALATDGVRVAHVRLAGGSAGGELDIVVPSGALSVLGALLSPDKDTRVALTDGALVVSHGDILFRATPLAGIYPDVLGMLPADGDFDIAVRADRAALVLALERVALAANADSREVRVTVLPDAVRLSAQADHEADETLPADVSGPGRTARFNVQLLLDGLRHCEGETVLWEFVSSGREKASRIQPDGGGGFRYYVLPYRDSERGEG